MWQTGGIVHVGFTPVVSLNTHQLIMCADKMVVVVYFFAPVILNSFHSFDAKNEELKMADFSDTIKVIKTCFQK